MVRSNRKKNKRKMAEIVDDRKMAKGGGKRKIAEVDLGNVLNVKEQVSHT